MNSNTYNSNYNPTASYFLENDMEDHHPNSSSYTTTTTTNTSNFFPTSPPQFDLYESLNLQHIYHHLFSDHHAITTSMELLNKEHDHVFASASPAVPKPAPKVSSSSINRSSKKDRHSKIETAHGLRDRRMRLSLDVAKRFFQLQDMLGYDKASQTVNWLLKSSLLAIRDLERERLGANYSSSTNSENRNWDVDAAVSSGLDAQSATGENVTAAVKVKRVKKKKAKLATRATVEKESRAKARERARARTSQKRLLVGDAVSDQGSIVRLESSNGEEIFASAPWNPPSSAFVNPSDHVSEIEFGEKPWES